jgi:eukaryotic-like serine/threonine-protein kinase
VAIEISHSIQVTRQLGVHSGVTLAYGLWQGCPVFVKTLVSMDEGQDLRFQHEGEVVGRLSHPGVVGLLARTPRQLIFPHVRGGTLRDHLDGQGPMAEEPALAVARGLLETLIYLHAQGVTHQDLKPENVLVEDGQHIRIIDFGMAHDLCLPRDTHAGTRMGTPHFMAPEQFAGLRGDPRSDLFSVGVLLWDALAGQPPYPDPLGWLAGLERPRDPLPGPAWLRPVLARTLERDPAARPQSAAELLALLTPPAPLTRPARA